MSEIVTYFVDVIVPIAVKNEFTYRVPLELNDSIQVGIRVIVPFGANKLYTAIVTKVHQQPPTLYQAKYIEYVLDDAPIITPVQYKFWKWMSAYYMAPIGDVMNAALPANFKLASETKITLHPEFDAKYVALTERQFQIIEALEVQETLDLKEISEIVGIKTIQPIIKQLIELRVVISLEELNHKYTPKSAVFYFLAPEFQAEEALNNFLVSLESQKGKTKQLEAMMILLSVGNFQQGFHMPVMKKDLIDKNASASALATLEKNGILSSERLQIDRVKSSDTALKNKKQLADFQQIALDEIRTSFESKDITLLHGVTGSGKTEIYVELIEEQLELGKQVLFLLPEIALTTQLIQRLSAYFGDLIGVYHSKFNQNERVEIWNHVLNDHAEKYRIVLGARSSVFLPFQNLGLVIVDEEHESSFKQHEPSPRYNARDAAMVLAAFFKAKTLLGSATPAVETYYNAQQGRYGLVTLEKRFGNIALPEVQCADLTKERREKTMQSHFSSLLMTNMKEALDNKEQIILFQNRRGYTPTWTCEICNWSPRCTNCDVTLTYHKHSNTLKCHYCGYSNHPMGSCNNCGSNRLRMSGFGTEKIEDELQLMFPSLTIARMDLDSTRSKNAYQQLISDFENRKIDVLIGTQMVTKGLDFDNVSLVGILDADMLLNRPDFRAFERSFQLMTQVAGRAGRAKKRGKVIIQTGRPDHWIVQRVMEHDYINFYTNEIVERRNFFYPPFYKLIYITLKHKEENQLNSAAQELANSLQAVFKERVIGPEFPIIKRINNLFIKEIKLKIERDFSQKQAKDHVQLIIDQFYAKPTNKSVRIVLDVDPN